MVLTRTCAIEHEYHILSERLTGTQSSHEHVQYTIITLRGRVVRRDSVVPQRRDHKLFIKCNLRIRSVDCQFQDEQKGDSL